MQLITHLKQKLLTHLPLWICAFLVTLTKYLPGSSQFSAVIILFFVYLLSYFLWRKYLKKRGKLLPSGGVFVTLLFWGGIIAALYMVTTVESPKLVLYETSEPAVFESKDSFPAPEGAVDIKAVVVEETKKEGEASEAERPEVMSEIKAALLVTMDALHSSLFACAYLQQQNLVTECLATTTETVRVELDNKAATVELLFADKKPEDCIKAVCNVWLIQTTQAAITQFNDIRKENAKSDAAPPAAEATVVDQWGGVVAPIVVLNTITAGWRHIQFTNQAGSVTTWQAPSQ